MSNYIATFNRVKKNEGGYAPPFGDSGETYKGIDRSFHASWPGWKIIDAYKQKFGIPANNAHINDEILDAAVADFYKAYLTRLVNIEAINNQALADFTADFLIHKMYDAVKVINAAALVTRDAIRSTVSLNTSVNNISDSVLFVMNANPTVFYIYLKDARRKYYMNPAQFGSSLKFSPALVAAFIDRINTFPQMA